VADVPKANSSKLSGPKFVTPLENNPQPRIAIVGGIRIQADLPPILNTACVGCETVPTATSGEPLIVESPSSLVSRTSHILAPNDHISTASIRSKGGDSASIATYGVTPVRVVGVSSSAPCTAACVTSGCSPACLRIYSTDVGTAVDISSVDYQRPLYVSDIHATSAIDQVLRSRASPQVTGIVPSSSVHCVQSSPCFPHCAASCLSVHAVTASSSPDMKVVSTAKADSATVQVHSAALATSPARVVASTSSSTCLPACMSAGCSVTCLRLYTPNFREVSSKEEGPVFAVHSAPSFMSVPSSSQSPNIVSSLVSTTLTQTCVSTCMPSCSESCVHIVHTSPVRVVSSTTSATCVATCMPSCEPSCRRLHVASGVSGGVPTQARGGDVVAVTANALAPTSCSASCMPACSASCLHIVASSPVRVVSPATSSTCIPACMSGGCSATCLQLYAVVPTVHTDVHASRVGAPTHDGYRVASGVSGGVPTTTNDVAIVGGGCVSFCQPTCSSVCLGKYSTTSVSRPSNVVAFHAVPMKKVETVPQFKQVRGHLVAGVSADSAGAAHARDAALGEESAWSMSRSNSRILEQANAQLVARTGPNAIVVILAVGIVIVAVSVGVAVYLLACGKKNSSYTEVSTMPGAQDNNNGFGEPDAVPASDSGHNSDVDAQAAGDGIAESGNSIWTSRSRPEQVQDV